MVKPALWVQGSMFQKTDKSEPPHLSPGVPDTFYYAIGELIVTWGLMERQLNILIWALLKHNNTYNEGWKGLPFDKRYDLFRAEWAKFAVGYDALLAFPKDACHSIRTGKALRDAITHKEMVLGLMENGHHFIKFYNKTRAGQKSKAYHAADFQRATQDAATAAGWLVWTCQPDALWPLPSPDTLLLRSLPNTDHLRLPT